MKRYKHINDDVKIYGVRDLSRGKVTEAVKVSLSQTVLIMKNNKKQSVLISYDEYISMISKLKQKGEKTNEQ